MVKILTEASEKVVKQIRMLLSQLSTKEVRFTLEELQSIISTDNSTLFVAEEEGCIVGMLTLASYRIPTGMKFWIEDVVVDEKARGKGHAKQLLQAAIDMVHEAGGGTIELTSRPSRVAARTLYMSIGFQPYETGVFKLPVD